MSQEYRAKIFKSGNSLALRLPKALGLTEGMEMRLREEHGRYIAEPVEIEPRKIDLTGIYGSIPGLGRQFFEQRERDWSDESGRND